MDLFDAAQRLEVDERHTAERNVLDDPGGASLTTISALLAKQGRQLGELRGRHKARRSRQEVAFDGTVFTHQAEAAVPQPVSPAYSPTHDPNFLASPAVTPSWGAFRTPGKAGAKKVGTATRAFLEASGLLADDDDDERFESFHRSDGLQRNLSTAPTVPKLDLDRSVRSLATEMHAVSLETPVDKSPWSFGNAPNETEERAYQTKPPPASPWCRFEHARSWVRGPEAAHFSPEGTGEDFISSQVSLGSNSNSGSSAAGTKNQDATCSSAAKYQYTVSKARLPTFGDENEFENSFTPRVVGAGPSARQTRARSNRETRFHSSVEKGEPTKSLWTKHGDSFAVASGFAKATASGARKYAVKRLVKVNPTTSFAHETLRPMDAGRMTCDDSALHKAIHSTATRKSFGRKPGTDSECRRSSIARGASLPSNRKDGRRNRDCKTNVTPSRRSYP